MTGRDKLQEIPAFAGMTEKGGEESACAGMTGEGDSPHPPLSPRLCPLILHFAAPAPRRACCARGLIALTLSGPLIP